MTERSTHGWAIRNHRDGKSVLLGKYFWIRGAPSRLPEHMNGYITVLYRTRCEARDALRDYKERFAHNEWMVRNYRRMTVVKAEVTVREI